MPGFVGANRDRGDRYGGTYQRDRRVLFAALPDTFICCRCHRPASKHTKEKPDKLGRVRSAVHLDHDEHGGYRGWAHNTCNRNAGAAKGGRTALAKRRGHRGSPIPPSGFQWRSRAW